MEEKCQKGYRQLQGETKPCQEINFDSLKEDLEADNPDRYEGVHLQVHLLGQFDDPSAVSNTY